MLSVPEQHNLVRALLHLALDEAQQVLLVHAGRVMNVSVNLTDVIEISMRHPFAVCHLLVLVEQHVEIELALEILQSAEGKTLARPIGRDVQDGFEVHIELPDRGHVDDTGCPAPRPWSSRIPDTRHFHPDGMSSHWRQEVEAGPPCRSPPRYPALASASWACLLARRVRRRLRGIRVWRSLGPQIRRQPQAVS